MNEKETPPGNKASRDGGNTQNENETTPAGSSESHSLTDRIKSSASGLLRNTISPSASSNQSFGNDLSKTLATASSLSGKPPPSLGQSSGGSSVGGMVESNHRSSSSRSTASASAGGGDHSSFRSQPFRSSQTSASEMDNQNQNNSFEIDFYGDSETLTRDNHDLLDSKGKGKGKEIQDQFDGLRSDATPPSHFTDTGADFNSVWATSSTPTTSTELQPPSSSSTHHHDGAAVTSLLSDPSFQPQLSFEDEFDPIPEPELDPFVTTTSFATQQQQPPTSTSASSLPLTSTNLIPDITSVLSALQNTPPASQSDQIAELPGVAEWLELDSQYHDVVWGYLKPYVEAARKEVEEKEKAGEKEFGDGPAVRRLGMVLGHLKEKGVKSQAVV